MSASLIRSHLRRRWTALVAATLMVAVAMAAWSSTRDATFETSSEVLLPSADEPSLIGQQRLVEASSELAGATATRLPGVSADEVTAAVEVRRDGTVLTIVARGSTPSVIRDIANAHADAYLDLRGPAVAQEARLIRRAAAPTVPVSPRPIRDGVIAGVLALVPCAAIVVLRSIRRDQIRCGDDVRSTATVLAELPLDETTGVRRVGLTAAESPGDEYVAAIESLFGSLRPVDVGRARRILVTGTDDEAEASQVAANLAWVAASQGWRTVLVGGDGRTSRLRDLLSPYLVEVPADQRRRHVLDDLVALPGDEGREHLAVALAGDHVVGHLVPTRAPSLYLMPTLPGASDSDPGAMLRSDVVGAVLDHLDGIADLVIIDSPAMSAADDACVLAGRADEVVVVAAAHTTSRHQLTECIRRLKGRHGRGVRGVVVNCVRGRVERQTTSSTAYARPSEHSAAAVARRELPSAPAATHR